MESETLYVLVIGVISALSGVLVGGGSVAVIFARLNQSVESKDSTEALLAQSVPAAVVAQINQTANRTHDLVEQVIPIFRDAVQFVKDVTDGKPNDAVVG
jgi:hypothetical protein